MLPINDTKKWGNSSQKSRPSGISSRNYYRVNCKHGHKFAKRHRELPFIIKNDYKETGRTVYLYEGDNNSALVSKIFTALMLGLKIMVVSDSKKFIKKLEAAMTVKVFDNQPIFGQNGQLDSKSENKLRIWSIHAENSGSEENVAFIKDISEEVKNVDVLLASPS